MRKVKNNFAKLNEISSNSSAILDDRLQLNFSRYRCFNDIPIRDRFNNVNEINSWLWNIEWEIYRIEGKMEWEIIQGKTNVWRMFRNRAKDIIHW